MYRVLHWAANNKMKRGNSSTNAEQVHFTGYGISEISRSHPSLSTFLYHPLSPLRQTPIQSACRQPPPSPSPPRRWYPSLHYTRREDYCTVFRIGDLHVFKEKRETRSIFGFIFSWIPPVETITTLLPWAELRMPISLNTIFSTTDSLKSYRKPGISSRFDT